MAGCEPTWPPLLAVLLSRDPILGARALRLCADGWRVVRVDSGYQAAAEIISAPVAVMLIDLRSLGGLHRGLLALARRMGVRLAAIAGETPADMTADDLRGLQRIAIGDIPAVLALARVATVNLGEVSDAPASAATLPEAPQASAADQPEPDPTPKSAPKPEPAPAPIPTPAISMADVPLPEEKRVMLTPRSGQPRTLAGLLTPDELANLLEDEQ